MTDLWANAVSFDDATVVLAGLAMRGSRGRSNDHGRDRVRTTIASLEARLTALEAEVFGVPADIELAEFATLEEKRNAREAAVDEYHRLQREEFYRKLPELKEQAAKQRAAFETFMRERGFEP